MSRFECRQCGLPDSYDGDGDGIGSCDCSRCEDCGMPPLTCHCDEDDSPWIWRPVETVEPAGGVP